MLLTWTLHIESALFFFSDLQELLAMSQQEDVGALTPPGSDTEGSSPNSPAYDEMGR